MKLSKQKNEGHVLGDGERIPSGGAREARGRSGRFRAMMKSFPML